MDEKAIIVNGLTKKFRTKIRGSNLFDNLKKIFSPEYKEINAVNKVGFSVSRGEIVAFIGPNGAGKSTTLKMLSGILYPDAGKISVLGLSPQKDRKALSYRIGTVFGQKPQLWFHLPPIDSFNLFAKIYEIDTQKYKLRIEELVKRFNISDIINQPVRKLSLGQRMRCEIVLSLIHHPEILFLDEPTIGLDIIAKKTIRELIREINEKEGTTVILTSHDMDDVEKICKRIIIINNGIIVYDGKIKDLKNKHMKMKKIKVLSETPLQLPNVSGMKIVKQKMYGATIEINTKVSPIKTVINSIIAKNNIIDIIIESPPIEEIIEEIYNRKII